MRTRAVDCGPVDGWRGARLGAEARDRARRELLRIPAQVDLGEPGRPVVTIAFLILTTLVTWWEFATFGTSPTSSELARAGGAGIGAIATGDGWKLLTANLLHGNVPHLLMNAFVIFLMGRWLEHLVGRVVVLATILWSMLLSSVGALVIDVAGVTIGASGVAFGLVGCAVAADPRARTATGLIARQLMVVNIIITFLAPGISIGGHLGGLLAGLAVGAACWMRGPLPDHPAGRARRAAGIVAIAVASPLCLLLAIGPRALPGELRAARGAIVAPLLERQLSGATLTNGRELDEARCSATDEPQRYRCVIDGEPTTIRFDSGTDQWAISSS